MMVQIWLLRELIDVKSLEQCWHMVTIQPILDIFVIVLVAVVELFSKVIFNHV